MAFARLWLSRPDQLRRTPDWSLRKSGSSVWLCSKRHRGIASRSLSTDRSGRIAMNRFARMVLACGLCLPLILAGCGGSSASIQGTEAGAGATAAKVEPLTPEQRLAGQWQGQIVLDEETEKQLPPAHIAKLREIRMGMEFLPDG